MRPARRRYVGSSIAVRVFPCISAAGLERSGGNMSADVDAWYADFMRRMVDKANANAALNDGTTGPIKKIIAGADLVLAVWQDPSAPYGVGHLIIKGDEAMTRSIAQNVTTLLRPDAILCDNAEMAEACRQVMGEA
jgi:hypothetical protein